MKQTAVAYLFEKLWQMPKDKLVWQHYLEKAKQMEKEQIVDAYDDGVWDGEELGFRNTHSEQYYQENYQENG